MSVYIGILSVVAAVSGRAAETCVTCHEGIEMISEKPGIHDLSCTDCHQGDGNATVFEAAHKGIYANPSDLRVVEQTCGLCHPDEVARVMKSLHATSAGMISGTRYAWGAQGKTEALYANYAVTDDKPEGPHAIKSLEPLPSYDPSKPEGRTNSPADDYLRNDCLRCHLWSDGRQGDGDYRASGCAACHVLYSNKGTYEGNDKAIPKDQKDRPRFHRITKKIPETQCLHCHSRGGRTGVSFIGAIESDDYGTPWTGEGAKQGKLHGKFYNHLQADIHYEKGMTCIDCHTMNDLHGDGNIYLKREHAVEIECHDCHGTMKERSNLKSSWGNPLTNIEETDGKVVLTSKLSGKKHVVPQLKEAALSPEGHAAMAAIPAHIEKLECYACHARWAPQCYGCHAKQDLSAPGGDWLLGKKGGDPSKTSHEGNRDQKTYAWSESRSYVRWESPLLGINSEGKVSPFITGCQVFFTQVKDGKSIVNNKVYTNTDGISGISHAPIQPHTVTKAARRCSDCHDNPKALGLGGGIYNIKANFPDGAPIAFELERIVNEDGKQLQGIAHAGARPFNKDELQRIGRAGTCIACHGADADVWRKVKGKIEIDSAPTDELHKKIIRNLFEKAAGTNRQSIPLQ
ncbi:MAG: hypothetical protein HYV36_01645 [Lentisphaerae bacterium]|nr:hypothetical protein [Lentisphaerota bacterium]